MRCKIDGQAGGSGRGAPVGAEFVPPLRCLSSEHQLGLSRDRTRATANFAAHSKVGSDYRRRTAEIDGISGSSGARSSFDQLNVRTILISSLAESDT